MILCHFVQNKNHFTYLPYFITYVILQLLFFEHTVQSIVKFIPSLSKSDFLSLNNQLILFIQMKLSKFIKKLTRSIMISMTRLICSYSKITLQDRITSSERQQYTFANAAVFVNLRIKRYRIKWVSLSNYVLQVWCIWFPFWVQVDLSDSYSKTKNMNTSAEDVLKLN